MSALIRFGCYLMAACIIVFVIALGLFAMVNTFGWISTLATYALAGVAVKIIDTIDRMPSIPSHKNRRVY